MDYTRFRKILIIKPSSLGDIIHALPVASALKAALPGSEVDWVVGAGFAEILEGNPCINRAITFRRDFIKDLSPGHVLELIRELRRVRYDLVIDLQGLLRSALMAYACRTDTRVGFNNAREGAPLFYTGRVRVPSNDMHAVDRYLLTLAYLGIEPEGEPDFRISLGPKDNEQADGILKGLEITGDFVAIAPSARWVTKRWPPEYFVRLANRILGETGMKCVFVGSAVDEVLISGCDERLRQEKSFAFGATTLKGLAALLKRARLLVTNDSGPMHIAAALGTPAAALFGPTGPKRTGPYGHRHKVISAGLSCSPCYKRQCDMTRCMTGLSVEQVFEEIRPMLKWR